MEVYFLEADPVPTNETLEHQCREAAADEEAEREAMEWIDADLGEASE